MHILCKCEPLPHMRIRKGVCERFQNNHFMLPPFRAISDAQRNTVQSPAIGSRKSLFRNGLNRCRLLPPQNRAEVDQVQLSPFVLEGCVDADPLAAATKSGVRVDTPFSLVLRRQVKVAKIKSLPAFDVK